MRRLTHLAQAALAAILLAGGTVQADDLCDNENTPFLSEKIGSGTFGCHSYYPNNGNHYINSDGGDIWGTQDAFTLGGLRFSGDVVIAARVSNLANTNPWAKGGVMIRAGLSAGSRNAFMAMTPSNGATFQTRLGDGQNTTNAVQAGFAAPHWVKIEKRGNTIRGFRSGDGVTWTQVGSNATIDFGNDFYVGLAAMSHAPGVQGTAFFENLTIAPLGTGGFISKAIGNPGVYGSLSESGGTYTIRAAGNDIWGPVDQFQFAYQQASGDRAIIARVASLENTDWWAYAGVMIRESLEPSSPNAFMTLTGQAGAPFQYRSLSGAFTELIPNDGIAAPHWVKLEKRGDDIKGFRSADGVNWTLVGGIKLNLGRTYYLGLAATSSLDNVLGTSTFTNVQVVPLESDGFQNQDIGNPSLAGSYSKSGGTHTLRGSGSDIWGTSDQFRYAFQKRKGDHTIIARVSSVQNTNGWAKAGLMIRTGLGANSRNAYVAISPSNGVTFQRRDREGASTTSQQNTGIVAPYWLKLEKRGSEVKAFRASDGINWTQVGGTANLNLGTEYYIGLAATSHTNAALGTAVFTDVLIVPAPSPSVLPIAELGYAESLDQFAMDQTEVTEEEFVSTMVAAWGASARGGRRGTLKPIANITWSDALLYANARSVRDGFYPAYAFSRNGGAVTNPCVSGFPGNNCQIDANTTVSVVGWASGYRLPTDAEWTKAASLVQNGPYQPNPSRYVWGLTETSETGSSVVGKHAVWNTTASAAVASKLPTQEGLALYDMAGNVGEWTFEKNVRGGSWGSTSAGQLTWSSSVNRSTLNYRDTQTGLRLVLPIARRDGRLLSQKEKERFLNAVFTLKHTKYPGYTLEVPEAERISWWDWYSVAHALTMMPQYYNEATGSWESSNLESVAHNVNAFLPFHRELINQLEMALQTVDPRISLPYIRWGYGSNQYGMPVAEASMAAILSPYEESSGGGLLGFGSEGWNIFDRYLPTSYPQNLPRWWPLTENGPVGGWTIPLYADMGWGADGSLRREPNENFPLQTEDVDPLFQSSLYEQTRQTIEGDYHNDFHNAIGGNMASMRAPQDPIFFLHHSEVDRTWAGWQQIHGPLSYDEGSKALGLNREDPLWPFSGNLVKPMDHMTDGLPWAHWPEFPKVVRIGEVLNRKMPKYQLD